MHLNANLVDRRKKNVTLRIGRRDVPGAVKSLRTALIYDDRMAEAYMSLGMIYWGQVSSSYFSMHFRNLYPKTEGHTLSDISPIFL